MRSIKKASATVARLPGTPAGRRDGNTVPDPLSPRLFQVSNNLLRLTILVFHLLTVANQSNPLENDPVA